MTTTTQDAFVFAGTEQIAELLDQTLHAPVRRNRGEALCKSGFPTLMSRTCDPWRLELRARETRRTPCPKCCSLRRHANRMVAMPQAALEVLQELQAYIDLAPLELDPRRFEAKVAMALAPALELLITQRPVAMVWVGKTGASFRWTPKTTERSHGPWLEVSTKGFRKRMSTKQLLQMFKPPTQADVAKAQAKVQAKVTALPVTPWKQPWLDDEEAP